GTWSTTPYPAPWTWWVRSRAATRCESLTCQRCCDSGGRSGCCSSWMLKGKRSELSLRYSTCCLGRPLSSLKRMMAKLHGKGQNNSSPVTALRLDVDGPYWIFSLPALRCEFDERFRWPSEYVEHSAFRDRVA